MLIFRKLAVQIGGGRLFRHVFLDSITDHGKVIQPNLADTPHAAVPLCHTEMTRAKHCGLAGGRHGWDGVIGITKSEQSL